MRRRPKPDEGAPLPIGARLVVELVLEKAPIGGDVGGFIGLAEEAVERLPGRQVADRGELQPVERHMGAAEIDRGDAAGIGDQIGEDVATSGRDRHHVALRRQRQRLHVDLGVLPNLRIDQALERPGEHDFEQAFARKRAIAAHRLVQAMAGRSFGCGRQAKLHVIGRIDRRIRHQRGCKFDDAFAAFLRGRGPLRWITSYGWGRMAAGSSKRHSGVVVWGEK